MPVTAYQDLKDRFGELSCCHCRKASRRLALFGHMQPLDHREQLPCRIRGAFRLRKTLEQSQRNRGRSGRGVPPQGRRFDEDDGNIPLQTH